MLRGPYLLLTTAEKQGERMEKQQQEQRRPYPPSHFWQAVLAMRNHVMISCKADYWDDLINHRRVEGSLWQAINIVGDYLDVLMQDGWLDDEE